MFVAMAISLVIAGVMASVLVFDGVFGLKSMVVMSGSMSPYMEAGDVALMKSSPAEDVRVGDVICFSRQDGNGLITHRVIGKKMINGDQFFQTKGDANTHPDGDLVHVSSIDGIVKGRIPKAGYVLQAGTSNRLPGLLVISFPVVLIVFWELRSARALIAVNRPGSARQNHVPKDL